MRWHRLVVIRDTFLLLRCISSAVGSNFSSEDVGNLILILKIIALNLAYKFVNFEILMVI